MSQNNDIDSIARNVFGARNVAAGVEFDYRTRAATSPQGKSRIFFACHPDDFARYFEEIAGDILERIDGAVWYLKAPQGCQPEPLNEQGSQPKLSAPQGCQPEPLNEQGSQSNLSKAQEEDLKSRLSDMQLIVMPVTSKLLTEENVALSVILPFANEEGHRIPILPIMEEKGLDALFARYFNGIQYLDPHAQDPTAIPYAEKLTKYLNGVLVGGETAAAVRAAFDAYIFMSYRKKDRVYAQRLMRLIHANPLCRDIAIWYDEYLVPGENFNAAIRDAMEKSSLFTLVVTPGILETVNGRPNYVCQYEYPAARAEGKPVLPVEMAATDRAALRQNFAGIETPVPGEASAVSRAMMEQIRALAITQNDSDPVHNFFIGLAYLDGIDVEVDTARAVNLITASAEAGVKEAMRKLADMYRVGKGVKPDYGTSVLWLEKYTAKLEEAYTQGVSEENYRTLKSAYRELGDAFQDLRRLADAEATYTKMRKIAEEGRKKGFTDAKRDYAISCDMLGTIAMKTGDLEKAEELYFDYYRTSAEFLKENKCAETYRDVAIAAERLGDVYKASGDYAQAAEYYELDRMISEILAQDEDSVKYRQDLAHEYDKSGDFALAQGKLAEAEDYYRKSFAIREKLAQELHTEDAQYNLSASLQRLGDAARENGNYREAEDYFEKCTAINERLAAGGMIDYRRALSLDYIRLADLAQVMGDLSAAENYSRRSLTIREKLVRDTGTIEQKRDLETNLQRLGQIAQLQGNFAEAEAYWRLAAEIGGELGKYSFMTEYRRDLAIDYAGLGGVLKGQKNFAEAETQYKKSLEIRKELADKLKTPESRLDVSIGYEQLGILAQEAERIDDACAYLKQSMAIREQLAGELQTVTARQNLALNYYNLGRLYAMEGALSPANEYFGKALPIFEDLAEKLQSFASLQHLAMCLTFLLKIAEFTGDAAQYSRYLRRIKEVRKQMEELA